MTSTRTLLTSLLLTPFFLTGCNLVVDFDRDRINADGGMDAGVDATIDAGVDSGTDGGGPACATDHEGCAAGELCCDDGSGSVSCQATSATQCEACGTACDELTSNMCTDRTCMCGTNAACEGATPICDDATGDCVECRDDADCTGGELCVENACMACNPADNSGCSDTTPICNATTSTCEACATVPSDNCPAPLLCLGTGACGGCDDNADCTTPTAGICDTSATTCRGCTSASDCMAELSLGICLPSGRCVTCNASDDSGCVPASTTPICADDGGANACRACAISSECPTATPVCDGSGACVECNAGDATACTGGTPVCDTSTSTCVECVGDGDCGTQYCDTGTNTCMSCTMDVQCASHPTGAVCASGACVACDATSCAGGCCGSGGACVLFAGQDDTACGTGGAACGACGTGLECGATGICECTATSCAGGCCSSGACVLYAAQDDTTCGTGGAACGACGAGLECGAAGTCECTMVSCSGCCNSGTCEAGTTAALCGAGGGACAACVNGFACAGGACECDDNADCDFGLCSGGLCDCDSSGGTGECAVGEVCASTAASDCTCTGGSC